MEATVKVEAQKVAEIEILSDLAVASEKATGTIFTTNTVTATVAYQVRDQYGEDITKKTDLATNDSTNITVNKTKGIVNIANALVKDKKVGDLIPVVLVDQNTGVSDTKTLKLSDASAVSEIEVKGIFNAKGKEVILNDKSKTTDGYIVLELKDQYGAKIKDAAKAKDLLITNTNSTIIEIANAVSKVKIGDNDELVIKFTKIHKGGSVKVLLISTTNGSSVEYTVEIDETTVTDGISISQPEIAVAGDVDGTLIPITITDKEGNVITDTKLLAGADKGIKIDGVQPLATDFVVKDGQVFYKKTFSSGNDRTEALVFQTSTYKVATITINVKADAEATFVRGLKEPLVLSTVKDSAGVTINTAAQALKYLIIEDQYNREMKTHTSTVVTTLVGESEVVSVAGNAVTPLKNGAAKLNIKLTTENKDSLGKTIDSAVEVEVRVTDGKEFDSYEIKEIGLVQAADIETAGAKEVTVYGILDGGKVALANTEYTATVTGGVAASGNPSYSAGAITINQENLKVDEKDNTKKVDTEFTLKVTINATGDVLEQKFTVSDKDKKVQEFFFTKSTTGNEAVYKEAKAVVAGKLAVDKPIAGANDLKALDGTTINVATVDQYANKVVQQVPATALVTIVPDTVTDVKITDNGKSTAKVEIVSDAEETMVTIKVKIGEATEEIRVTVEQDPDILKAAEAIAALTGLEFDSTKNAINATPEIKKPADHANGAAYTLAVSNIVGNNNGGNASATTDVAITRDTDTSFTFDITVTATSSGKTATKVFAVTVPTGTGAVTISAK